MSRPVPKPNPNPNPQLMSHRDRRRLVAREWVVLDTTEFQAGQAVKLLREMEAEGCSSPLDRATMENLRESVELAKQAVALLLMQVMAREAKPN